MKYPICIYGVHNCDAIPNHCTKAGKNIDKTFGIRRAKPKYGLDLFKEDRAVKEIPVVLKIESLSYTHVSTALRFAQC